MQGSRPRPAPRPGCLRCAMRGGDSPKFCVAPGMRLQYGVAARYSGGAVGILARNGRSTPILTWPKDGQGAALRTFNVLTKIPPEPSQVLVIFFNDLEVAALSSWIHGQSIGI
jgi:hypothetical protein